MTTQAELSWDSELRFRARSGTAELVLDSNGVRGPSPMQTLAMSLAACMAIDVVDILAKGRHDLRALSVTFTGVRAANPPKRFEEMTLHYTLEGAIPKPAIERALSLSREKYCSVWHSMRQDIRLTTTFEVK